MAAILTDEGRFPAVQKISKDEYDRFVDTCNKPSEPSKGLVELMAKFKRTK